MADLSVKVCGVEFNNPLIAASGTFGFGMEYSELYPLEKLGGISRVSHLPAVTATLFRE